MDLPSRSRLWSRALRLPGITTLRIALLLGLALVGLRLNGCRTLSVIDTPALDLRLFQRGVTEASGDVVIVAIDDESIEEVGRWPWSRPTQAALLDAISAAGPTVIGFDVVQSEASAFPDFTVIEDRVDPAALAAVRAALQESGSEDLALVTSVEKSGRVILGHFFSFEPRPDAVRLPPFSKYNAVQSGGGNGERLLPEARSLIGNLPELGRVAAGDGFFNTLPDAAGGSFRHIPLAVRHGDDIALPLVLSMLQVHQPQWSARIRFAPFGVEHLFIGPIEIPVSEDGQLLLNYRGPGKTFLHVSAADILAGRSDPELLRGKLVLIGVTATAVADVRATPFDGVFPGVEMHATALDNILRQDFLYQPRSTVLLEVAAMLLSTLLLGFALRRARGVSAALVAIGLVGAYLVASQWLFLSRGIPLGIVYPLLAIAVVYGAISVYQFVGENRQRRQIHDAFSRYLNPELARQASKNHELIKLGGERRELTVLFSDIRGFTTISEGLEPEELVDLLNVYLGEMTEVVFRHNGTLDKYIGDAIMAIWGAPLDVPDHAAEACRAALEMVAILDKRRPEWVARGWPVMEAGIGLHTGEMVVGNMGSASHLSYTAMGDNVNLGSRLEGLTKYYGVQLLISEETLKAAGSDFVARELDLVAVKGKALPVRIFELLGAGEEGRAAFASLVDDSERALSAFRERRWDEALEIYDAILAERGEDGPSRLFADRCREYRITPPSENWDGINRMTTK